MAQIILALHVSIIVFNVAGLVVIPLGAWFGWRIVRIAWLRLVHFGLLAIVAGQALAGRACILTIWQNDSAGNATSPTPLIIGFVDRLIFWNLPFWVFTVMYCVVFLYVLLLTVLVPFWHRRSRGV